MILWLNPASGLSGDMLLGALLDLGAPIEEVRRAVASTGLDGWDLQAKHAVSGGIAATKAVVQVTDTAPSRRASELLACVRRAVPTQVAQVAAAAVTEIARAEARLHGEDADTVHLHEIGGLDTVVDTVGVAAALHLLGVDELWSAPLALGAGTVRTRHGVLPAPAPATVALLQGAHIVGCGVQDETVTPTGAALLKAAGARYGPLPPMIVGDTGYGAGTREFPDRPNVLQATLGRPVGGVESLVVLETNVDDVSGEVLGHLLADLLAAGAADAWITPAVMKKGRPAHVVHVLATPERVPVIEEHLFAGTGSLGLRRGYVHRPALERSTEMVRVQGHRVRVKLGPWGAKPEHDDLAAAAHALGLPLRQVAAEAQVAAASMGDAHRHNQRPLPEPDQGPPEPHH